MGTLWKEGDGRESLFIVYLFFTFSTLNYMNVKQGGKEGGHNL